MAILLHGYVKKCLEYKYFVGLKVVKWFNKSIKWYLDVLILEHKIYWCHYQSYLKSFESLADFSSIKYFNRAIRIQQLPAAFLKFFFCNKNSSNVFSRTCVYSYPLWVFNKRKVRLLYVVEFTLISLYCLCGSECTYCKMSYR